MQQRTMAQRFETRKETSKKGLEYFSKPFPHIEQGLLHYHYLCITTNLMVSKSLEDFIFRHILLRDDYSEKLGFDEEFDWITHVVVTAQMHAGKGNDRLPQYSYIHGSIQIIKHYECKILKMILDNAEGNSEELVEFANKKTIFK